ncbi:MAG: alpha/beta fold hydrolase [Oligoflexales bacterium]|nr:alpha/beta fold hydrolase [Oligoflexales bacterium]
MSKRIKQIFFSNFGLPILIILQFLVSCGRTTSVKKDRFFEVDFSNASSLVDCKSFLEELQVYESNPHFFKKMIRVPLDWSDRNSKESVNVFVYGIIGISKVAPIVFINGGPFASSHTSFKAMSEEAENLKLDFVFFDQRGTGCSTNIPELNNLDELRKIKYFRTVELVQDIEAIKLTLWGKNKKIKIMGQSFGGFLGFRYFSTFPDSVLSLHIHGYALMKDNLNWYINRFYSQKKVAEHFFELYPQAKIDFDLLNKIIPHDLCLDNFGNKECGPKILQFMTGVLGQFTQWKKLAGRIAQLLTTDRHLNRDELVKWLGRYGGATANYSLAKILVTFTEVNVRNNFSYDYVGCRSFLDRLNSLMETYDNWILSECKLTDIGPAPDVILDMINGIGFRPYGYYDLTKSLNESDSKLFLYSSEYDPYVPPASFNDLAAVLVPSRHTYMEIKNSGHDAFLKDPSIWRDLFHDR